MRRADISLHDSPSSQKLGPLLLDIINPKNVQTRYSCDGTFVI